jgi:putative ABC transport system permease protein
MFRLALRNVFRNRRRSGITMAVIIFGAVGLILFGGYKAITFRGLRESTIRGRIGHLQIFPTPVDGGLADVDAVRAAIQSDPRVKTTAAQITLMGLIGNGDKSETFMATAVEPEKDREMKAQHIVAGSDLPSNELDAVLLGQGLAKSLAAKPGDFLTLMTTTAAGSLNAIDVRVAGVFASGVKEYDERAVKMSIAGAQLLTQSQKVEKLLVFLNDTNDTSSVREDLARMFAQRGWKMQMKSWTELAPFYHQVVLLFNGIFGFLGLIVFAVVVFSVANTVVMSIFERTREIGTLMAIGTSRNRIWRMFFAEGLLIGLIGGLAGLGVAALLATVINHGNVMLPPPPGYTVGYRLQILLETPILATSFLISVLTATISSILPALKASRMNIVDALGHI